MDIQRSFKQNDKGFLYLVPTPIGNLEDITLRALKILESVNLIVSEDTRHTQNILEHFNIKNQQISFHKFNIKQRIPFIIDKLLNGFNIAQVSDAGMPCISDPGHELVVCAIKNGIHVIPLPGASAGITALIGSGLSEQPFLFYGFLPKNHTKLLDILNRLKYEKETLIFYESPYRIINTLKYLLNVLGPDRNICICRELTKIHEEFIRGTIEEINNSISSINIKGEIVLIVSGNFSKNNKYEYVDNETLKKEIQNYIKNNYKTTEAIKMVSKKYNLNRQNVYNIFHHLNN